MTLLKLDARSLKFYFWRGSPVTPLTHTYKRLSGRSTKTGRITVFHRGCTLKRLYRNIDLRRSLTYQSQFYILRTEIDPLRSNSLFLIFYYHHGLLSYIPSFLEANFEIPVNNYFTNPGLVNLRPGDLISLNWLPTGSIVNNVENSFGSGFKYSRASLSFSTIVKHYPDKNFSILKLPSGKFRYFYGACKAVFGYPGFGKRTFKKFNKAGNNRLVGKRPVVRGVAMNPVDHPHGGGEGKTSGGRLTVSPWGRLTKGFKTKKYYVYSRTRKFSY